MLVSHHMRVPASRVEALTRQYGAGLLVTENTWAAAGEGFVGREVDRVRVKGKAQPVGVWEVLAESGSPQDTAELRSHLLTWAEGLSAYRDQQWTEALRAFTGLTEDPAAAVFADRCRHLQEHPPGEEWDGVWVMKTK